MGLKHITNAVGFNYNFNQHIIFGIASVSALHAHHGDE